MMGMGITAFWGGLMFCQNAHWALGEEDGKSLVVIQPLSFSHTHSLPLT